MQDPRIQFEKTLLSLERQRKSRIYAIVHTDDTQNIAKLATSPSPRKGQAL